MLSRPAGVCGPWLAAPLALLAAVPGPADAKAPPAGFAASAAPAAPPHPADGSIFNVATAYAPLITGTRARNVGDIVTIVLTETTTTSKSVTTKQSRGGNEALTPPTVGPFSFNPNALNAGATSSFSGAGNTAQTNALNGTIAVTVAEVRPNGVLLVRGQKQMMFSQGNEWITITGLIRATDIDPTADTISSAQVADAHIEYSGNGTIQRSGREGWLYRVFNILSPF